MELIRNGKARGAIHIATGAAVHEIFAAEELARYIHAITGAQLPIVRRFQDVPPNAVVLANLSDPATAASLPTGIGEGLRHDGYRIRSVNGRLYIVSNAAAGLVFGVYEYLRHFCGCGFTDYAPRGETIPRAHTIGHGAIDLLDNPACWYRAMQIGVRLEPEPVLSRRIDWMAKNGYSHVLINHGNSRQNLVDGLFSQDDGTEWAKYRSWLIPALQKRGLQICLGHHNFAALLPPEQYLESNPEYFALLDGKRQASGQLEWCLSNPALAEAVSRRLLELVRSNPEIDLVSLWPSDGLAPLCQCPACAALDHPRDAELTDWNNADGSRWARRGNRAKARRYLHLCNLVADRLASVHPQLKLSTIAYADLADPPSAPVQVHPNIVVHLALYWRCSKHGLDVPDCPPNSQYAAIMLEWLKIVAPGHLVLTTYEEGMGCWKSLPFPVASLLFHDWARFKKLGIGGFKTNATTKSMAVYSFNYAAQSQAVRETAPVFNEFAQRYCQTFFGAAAAPMEKLYLHWETCFRNARADHVDPSPLEFLGSIFSPAELDQSRALCEQALALTKDPINQWRIERIRALIEYTAINCAAPAAVLIELHRGQKLLPDQMATVQEWVDREGELVRPHLALDDDLFGDTQYALRFLQGKRWLQRIEKQDQRVD